jgi:tetratricopeptide (TPR) repeat protein
MDPCRAAVFATLLIVIAGCAGTVSLPQRALELNAAGAQAIAQGRLAEAAASLAVALEYSPRFVEAWVNIGYVELGRGNFEQARRDFSKARDLNQDIPAPHHALGLLADRQGRGDDAEKFYRAALKVDPGFAPSRANLARRLYARGAFEEAREQFERLEAVAPDAIEGWVGEAETLFRLNRGTQAESVVERTRDRFGDVPELRLLVARGRIERSEWTEAEAILAPLAGSSDRVRGGAAWAWIAIARAGRGDAEGARDAALAALAIDPDDAVARYVLGREPP